MLQSITWPQYFTYLIIVILAYYLFVWLVFFKANLSFLTNISGLRPSVHAENQPDELMATAQHTFEKELKAKIIPIKESGYLKTIEKNKPKEQKLITKRNPDSKKTKGRDYEHQCLPDQ